MNHEAIINYGRAETLKRMEGWERVLLVQDTTSFDFSHHPATQGLGILENKYMRGFLAHSTLAVSADGVPLGLLEQKAWARGEERTRDQRYERAFGEKESYKWVEGLPDTSDLPEKAQTIVVCDAEAHIYNFFDVLHEKKQDYIVRAADYRSFTEAGKALFDVVAEQKAEYLYEIQVQRRPDREARTVQVELRFGQVIIRQPKDAKVTHERLTLQFVDVMEVNPPDEEKPIHWLLLTCLPVTDVESALQIAIWYRFRWLIERFHYVLKSGCKLEESQLREEKRLERLLGVYSLVAWKLLWLTYQSRLTPDAPCTVALQKEEWQALYLFTQKTKKLPAKPPTLRQVTRWIGQLGGFLGRKGDGEPGVKVLWRGWSRLQDIVETFTLFSPQKDVGNG